MTPNYVARKSKAKALNIWLILFFWLIIPLIIQIVRVLAASCYSIEIYDQKIVVKSGVLNKSEKQAMFAGVYAVSLEQSFIGRIFDYGDIRIDAPGNWADINTVGIKSPREFKNFLETQIKVGGNTQFIAN
jgi:uncharacterized membrane protein YdbT with pleckstrin-like domain